MIGVTGEDRHRAVELLQNEDPHELMGNGQAAEGERPRRLGADLLCQAVGTADDEAERTRPGIARGGDAGGEGVAALAAAALVQRDDEAGDSLARIAAASSRLRSSGRRPRLSAISTMSGPERPRPRPSAAARSR